MAIPVEDVTQLLHDWRSGDQDALNRLLPLVYDELRRLAAGYLRRERHAHTLQTTDLVHEAYLKLVDQTHANWENRAQFFGVAAQFMRRILVDHARSQRSGKRGSGAAKVTLGAASDLARKEDVDVLALDDALQALAAFDPRQSRIVELRYFAGLEIDETAEVLGISPATVKREWNLAKAWLYNQLNRR